MIRVCTILLIAAGLSATACSGGGGGGGSSPSPPPPPPPPSGGWAFTGSLNTARDSHTATVLTLVPNAGKMLVAGGWNGTSIFTSAELYDPVAATWTSTGAMAVPRKEHTATLLPNGTVLVAGGFTTSTTATEKAEIYDPVAGTWSPTGSMTSARVRHTATLLADGTVLVAGGIPSQAPGTFILNTAEIYNPTTGLWTATGSMATARQAQSATLLPSGKTLVAGGTSGTVPTELYDPATGAWAPTGILVTPRSFHGALLLPTGKVLVAGGVAGGIQGSVPLASAELYDPSAGTWTGTGPMSIPRSGPTPVLLPTGSVLMAGGLTAGNVLAASAEVYVPASGTWTASGSMGTARTAHTTTLLPTGQALAAGGVESNASRLATAVLFTPTLPGTAGNWTATGNLNTPRQSHTATLLTSGPNAGKVLAVGGETASDTATASAELYDPAGGTWATTGSMIDARQAHTATVLVSGPNAAKILVAGGVQPNIGGFVPVNTAELYDGVAGSWAATGASGVGGSQAAVLLTSGPNAGKILMAGGLVSVAGGFVESDSAELYDPVSGAWSSTSSMITPRTSFTLTMLPTGKVLAAGGLTTGLPTTAAEIYDPATGTWTATGSLATARAAHIARGLTFGPNGGRVLVAGGSNDIGDAITSFELYDPATGNWSAPGNLQQPRAFFTATLLPNGGVLAAGGQFTVMVVTQTAEIFNPRTGAWSLTKFMDNGRAFHTATLLPQGQVLVSGGQVANAPSVLSELYPTTVP